MKNILIRKLNVLFMILDNKKVEIVIVPNKKNFKNQNTKTIRPRIIVAIV